MCSWLPDHVRYIVITLDYTDWEEITVVTVERTSLQVTAREARTSLYNTDLSRLGNIFKMQRAPAISLRTLHATSKSPSGAPW